MRIVCDNCGAKYQISDEKVRNKVFKIRCKRCAHVIVVRANQPEAAASPVDEPTRVVSQPESAAPASPPADAVWYVVVNREQVGPLTGEQVREQFAQGEVDSETFTWAEGMTDWIRLASVPEFTDLAPAPEAVPDPEVAVPASSEDAEIFSSARDDDDDGVMASNNQDAGLFAGDDGFDEGPRVSSTAQLKGQRNENSVLFSLDALSAASAPKVTSTGGSEASGLIDISALGSFGMPAGGGQDDTFGGDIVGPAPVPMAPSAPMPSYVTASSGGGMKVALLVVGILLLLGLAGGAWVMFGQEKENLGQEKDPIAIASQAPVTVAVTAPSAAPVTLATAVGTVAAPASAAVSGTVAPESAAAPTSVASVSKKRSARRPNKRRTPRRSKKTQAEDRPAARSAAPATKAAPVRKARTKRKSGSTDEVDDLLGGLGKPAKKRTGGGSAPAATSDDPMLPEKLSRNQILRVVKKNAGSIRGCKAREPGASGNVMVGMVIGGKGRVTSAKVKSGPFKGTPVGNCVEGKVRSFRFPQFRGDKMRINMPFSL